MASYGLAHVELPSVNDGTALGDDPTLDLILLLLQQLTGDVNQLNSKVDGLQETTDNLQTTVGILALQVQNNENDIEGMLFSFN